MRGEILAADASGGLIAGADGSRYRFEPADYRRDAPRPGLAVDFVVEGDMARDIYPLTSAVLAGLASAQAASAWSGGSAAGGQGGAPGSPPGGAAFGSSFGAAATSAGFAAAGFAATTRAPPRDRGLLAWFFRAATDNYAAFRGRARRKEYWSFVLFYGVFLLLLSALTGIGGALSHFGSSAAEVSISPLFFLGTTLLTCLVLGMIVPSLSVAVRRLHDIGHSGWWLLLHLIPGLGYLALFVMSLIDGEPRTNRFGPPEK